MKKFLLVSILTIALVASFGNITVTHAQTTPVCPLGYVCNVYVCPVGFVCTPANPVPGCPTGYTCTPVTCSYVWSTDLTLGSTGADVVALQTWLINNGYGIPEITSGSVAKGTYDAQTAAAVALYQTAKGIPSTGFFGPLTRASLNGSCTVPTPPFCYTFTRILGHDRPISADEATALNTILTKEGFPGAAFTSYTPAVTARVVSFQAKYNLSETTGNVGNVTMAKLNSLYSCPTVSAAGTITSITPTAINTNSINNINITGTGFVSGDIVYVVSQDGTTKLSLTPLISSSTRMYAYIDNSNNSLPAGVYGIQIGKGSARSNSATLVVNGATPTLSIVTSLDAASPLQRTVQISKSAQTDNVVLLVLDLKSQYQSTTLKSLRLTISPNISSAVSFGDLFSNIKINSGNTSYSADALNILTSFNTISIPLPSNQNVPIYVVATIKQDTTGSLTGATAHAILNAINAYIYAVDSSGNQIAVAPGQVVGSDVTFSSNPVNNATPSITVTSPNGGETLQQGAGVPITWVGTNLGSGKNVRIDLLDQNGNVVTTLAPTTPNDSGTYTWTIPTGFLGTYKIQVTEVDNTTIKDTSNAIFTIIPPITITPNLPASVNSGSSLLVSGSGFTQNDTIYFSTGGSVAASVTPSSFTAGNIWFTVPSSLSPGTYSLQVGYGTARSNAVQIVVVNSNNQTLTVTYPNGGEAFMPGTATKISWNSTNFASGKYAKVDLLDQNGNVAINITPSMTANTGFYFWTVPNVTGSFKIQVTSLDNTTVKDTSDGFFTIGVSGKVPPPQIAPGETSAVWDAVRQAVADYYAAGGR